MSSPGGTGIASRNEGKGKCHLSFQVNDEERCFLEPERNDESGDSGRSRERRDDGGRRSGILDTIHRQAICGFMQKTGSIAANILFGRRA
jgi:hypothetical protein